MKETTTITSKYFSTKHRIHGHLAHDIMPGGSIRWFIYAIEDLPCQKMIVGSTQNPVNRWANHKKDCNRSNCKSTGLSKHFTMGEGCPFDPGPKKSTLNITLVDYYDTTADKLKKSVTRFDIFWPVLTIFLNFMKKLFS